MKESPSRVFGDFMENNYWYDTGDLPLFLQTSMHLLDRLLRQEAPLVDLIADYGGYEEVRSGIWAEKGTALPQGVDWTAPVIVGRDLKIPRGAKIGPYVILGDRTEIASEVNLSHAVTLEGATVNQSQQNTVLFESRVLV
jgi:NDP-sugar pyrophosphorylase family protein